MKLILIPLILFNSVIFSQEYRWWNNTHQWDGVTPWYEYFIISPKYLGPNALPVPEYKNGRFENDINLDFSFVSHNNPGDHTQNLYSKLMIPIVAKKVGISLSGVPIEIYKTDTATRDMRKSREYDAQGHSIGDLYITTYLQLLQDHEKYPDLLLSINLKTASGSNLYGARFADSPGYYFDFSSGKTFSFKNTFLKSIRPYYILGFYSWQTNQDQRQNDAFIFGIGCDIEFKKIMLSNHFGGYIGYIGDGDKPIINRVTLKSNFENKLNYFLTYQQGFKDYNFTSFMFGMNFKFIKKK